MEAVQYVALCGRPDAVIVERDARTIAASVGLLKMHELHTSCAHGVGVALAYCSFPTTRLLYLLPPCYRHRIASFPSQHLRDHWMHRVPLSLPTMMAIRFIEPREAGFVAKGSSAELSRAVGVWTRGD